MASAEPSRRSGRQKRPTRKYNEDPFAGLDIDSDNDLTVPDSTQDQGEDDDFAIGANEADLHDDVYGSLSDEHENVEQEDDSAAKAPEDDEDRDQVLTGQSRPRERPRRADATLRAPSLHHTRLTSLPVKTSNKDKQAIHLLGGTDDAASRYLENRNRLFNEITTPSRAKLQLSSFSQDREPTVTGREWYERPKGRAALLTRQQLKAVALSESSQLPPLSVLLGPASNLRLFTLRQHVPFDFNIPFRQEATSPIDQSLEISSRRAWLINAGQPVQSLAWSFRKRDSRQYLAVATGQMQSVPDGEEKRKETFSFSPSVSHQSKILVYGFTGTPSTAQTTPTETSHTISMEVCPTLNLSLNADWGTVRQLKWSPMEPVSEVKDEKTPVGLLAILTMDGKVRVLDITLSESSEGTIQNVVTGAAFVSRPPETVCTCIEWLSSSVLVAGCANGQVAIWNVAKFIASNTKGMDAVADIYFHAITGYITHICTCLPSRPGFFIVSTVSGSTKLIQLPDVHVDNVFAPPSRYGTPFLVWMDSCQYALASQDLYEIRAYNFRRFYASQFVCRQPSHALCAATSAMHSSMIVGCADGSVTISNALRKLIAARTFPDADHRQTWFTHDWRRPTAKVYASPVKLRQQHNEAGLDHSQEGEFSREGHGAVQSQLNVANGLSRIITGWKVDSFREQGTSLSGEPGTKGKKFMIDPMMAARQLQDGTMIGTIYEEPSAVRAVAWNPNQSSGGWAAAGMGDGLILVEDLCHD